MFSRSSLVGVAVAAASLIAASPAAVAGGETCGGGYDLLTAKVSDSTPASGQEFIVHGKLYEMGMPGKDHVIRMQTRRDGAWQGITRIRTDEDGTYRVRLILSTTGRRILRAVAVGAGDEDNQATRFVVHVH